MLAIGPYILPGKALLAPMAGVSDLPFRAICRQHGAALTTGEMITSDQQLWHSRKSQSRLPRRSEPEPRSVQIVGNDPLQMAAAAQQAVNLGAQIIDINMGCPAKKVCKKAAGSALLRDQKLVSQILSTIVDAVDVPVTLKIRTGWDKENRNGVEIAKLAEDSGIQALAVHGRTRACRFKGHVEYDTIAAIKQAVAIPVIANGDISTPQQAARVLQYTGADAVMLGRAAQGQPWLFSQINHYLEHGTTLAAPSQDQLYNIVISHMTALHQHYGELMGTRISRKHIGWYLAADQLREFRQSFNQLSSTDEQLHAIDHLFSNFCLKEFAA
ncbi:MAG: tRNA dihydrouridine synthase DusB [Pseudomonadales bacterium]